MDNGLTASMENGKELTMGDNGQAITVFYGVSISATSPNLTVQSGTCEHKNTTVDRKEPTCGVEGHEKITCKDCGVTVSDTVLNATGKHTYGEWTIMSQPQVNIKGYQERTCSSCLHRDVQEIPALSPDDTTTNNNGGATPSVTDDPEDPEDPDETGDDDDGNDGDDDVGSNMSDLSRVFLTIVIIIFSLAVLLIVGGYWMSSRRNKARAARRNRRPSNRR
jgi:cbb3-type cytochrome oxidase subunit 3